MMTEETLNKIIEDVKTQLRYDEKCSEALQVVFTESYPLTIPNLLWNALAKAVDTALGVTDVFDWWVWETNCGAKSNSWIELDGVRYPLTNAREILEYAKAERKYKEERK